MDLGVYGDVVTTDGYDSVALCGHCPAVLGGNDSFAHCKHRPAYLGGYDGVLEFGAPEAM